MVVFSLLILQLVSINLCNGQSREFTVIRNTTLGRLRGAVKEPLPGQTLPVEYFYGIPYANPPVDDLRFEAPESMPAWRPEVRDALNLHPACPQMGEYWGYIQEHRPDFGHSSEDCLYLNVFVPRLNISSGIVNGSDNGNSSSEALAVLVFIHGGSNIAGTANMFDGDILAATGKIIVVSVNYRLGTLGFLGTGHDDFPGNYGLLDMIAALRWVKDNIAFYNGDPDKVTVLGHSAASMDVGILLVSPMATGLFRSVICQSGAPTSPWGSRRPEHNSEREVFKLGEHLNCERSSLKAVKECLKTINVTVMMKNYPMYDEYQFPAVVGDAVVPKYPKELLKSGAINAKSLLIGTTRDEGGRWSLEIGGADNLLSWMVNLHILSKDVQLKDLVYLEYDAMNYPKNETTDLIITGKAIGDAIFDAGTVETLELLSSRNISLHQYRWEWRSSVLHFPEHTGVPHGSDLFYLFGSPIIGHGVYNFTEEDKIMSRILMEQWSHFVKFETFQINSDHWQTPPTEEDLGYNLETKPYTRFYKEDDGTPAIGVGYDLKPRKTIFWTSVMPGLLREISKAVLAAKPETTERTGKEREQSDLYLILFIIFLILSCLLLFMLTFVCAMVFNRRKGDLNLSK